MATGAGGGGAGEGAPGWEGRALCCPKGAQSDLGGPWQEAVQGEPPGGSGKSRDRGSMVPEEAWLRQAVRLVTFTSTQVKQAPQVAGSSAGTHSGLLSPKLEAQI